MKYTKKTNFFPGLAVMLVGLLIFASICCAGVDDKLYADANSNAKNGAIEYAFMNFHSILAYSAASQYYKEALFACGEYYYLAGAYTDAEEMFIKFIQQDSDSEAFLFALAYLFKISRQDRDSRFSDELKKQIIESHQLSLLFSDFKENKYLSPLNKKYKALYFIDRVEFYIDGKIFEKIEF
ncbi:MAG: hypothetical protein ABII88_03330 [Candidatus Omnitrophota bacterium]